MDQVIISAGRAVAALGFPHRQENIPFFYIGIAYALISDKLTAAALEKMQIFGIIHDAHAVSFAIRNPMSEPGIRGGKFMQWRSPFSIFRKTVLISFFAASLTLSACGQKRSPDSPPPPDHAVAAEESHARFLSLLAASNQDLESYSDMAPTISKSLAYVNSKPAKGVAIDAPHIKVTWGELARTLTRLRDILPKLDRNPGLLERDFIWVPLPGGIAYSGYYEPRVKASRTKKPGYEQAIYKVPPDLEKVRRKRGRYYDRRTIEEQQILAGKGLELAWAADPVDVFYLEIQGSGKLVFDDGTEAYINYAGQNGHKYKSSGRIMREKGLLKRGDIFEQREWFKNNPDRVREILNENPSYVFFKFGGRGPTGAMGHTVDDWLSLATDRSWIPLGSIVAFGVNIPDQKYGARPLRGIGFAQDVGGAIKRNRIDIFCGSSERSNYVASHLDASGPAWILLAK